MASSAKGMGDLKPAAREGAAASAPVVPVVADTRALDENVLETDLFSWSPKFEPKRDARLYELQRLMKDGRTVPFVNRALIRNSKKILSKLKNQNGAIVVGSKLGGKSQTLEFLSQFLRARTTPSFDFVFKISMKQEGAIEPPSSTSQFFFEFAEVFFCTGGVLDQCQRFLLEKLPRKDVNDISAAAAVRGDVANHLDLDRAEHMFVKKKPRRIASLEELATIVLSRQKKLWESSGAEEMETKAVSELMRYVFELFKRKDTFVQGNCYLIVDEVGEALNGNLKGEAAATSDNLVLPMINMLQEQSHHESRALSVILSGSTSVASHILKEHLQKFECKLDGFDGRDCTELWGAWRNSVEKTPDELDAAEHWMQDVVASIDNEGSMAAVAAEATAADGGESSDAGGGQAFNQDVGVQYMTDGVPGFVVELFRVAIGSPPSPSETLAHMVDLHYNKLKGFLTGRDGGMGAESMQKLLQQEKYADFSEFGLAASSNEPPAAPILRRIFHHLRHDGSSEKHDYTSMLGEMARLHPSGSFRGAVYQEQVLNHLLTGATVYAREVLCDGEGGYSYGEQVPLNRDPALFHQYSSTGEIKPSLYLGPFVAPRRKARIEQNPQIWVYFAESQTFPSIDLTIAVMVAKNHVQLCHCSISVERKHFSTTLLSNKGHLPLDIRSEPPRLLRSERAKREMRAYRDAILRHPLLTANNLQIDHIYGVFDDHASDLLTPTTGYQATYWHLSTQTFQSEQTGLKQKQKKTTNLCRRVATRSTNPNPYGKGPDQPSKPPAKRRRR